MVNRCGGPPRSDEKAMVFPSRESAGVPSLELELVRRADTLRARSKTQRSPVPSWGSMTLVTAFLPSPEILARKLAPSGPVVPSISPRRLNQVRWALYEALAKTMASRDAR